MKSKRKPFDEIIPKEIHDPIGDAFDLITAFTVVAERRIEKIPEHALTILENCRRGVSEQFDVVKAELIKRSKIK